MEKYVFRKAWPGEETEIMEIMEQAKRLMHSERRAQWDGAYPALEHIQGDIARGDGYVMEFAGGIMAYAAVIFTGEPAYNTIDGAWLSDLPYVVVHRLAVADGMRRRGLAAQFMREVESMAGAMGIRSFRVDTNFDNVYMLKIIDKLGFTYCGDIKYQQGFRRAYEKLISSGSVLTSRATKKICHA